MTMQTALLLLRRAALRVVPGIAIAAVSACPAAHAQNSDANALANAAAAFSSSTDGAPSPSAAEPAAAGKPVQAQENSYGYRHRGWSSRMAFEVGGGGNGPVSDSSNDITWGGNLT